ncbi:hypothetical protein [Actinoalloteichus caeruleus]|uniref:hypothetical protein n=1 Tax=Actinoalloteichus cyanogriseus TaxID=2893586 RepID=UPI000B02DCEA|nr:hypothetical protein [Actinoalloteichus caeruleus]
MSEDVPAPNGGRSTVLFHERLPAPPLIRWTGVLSGASVVVATGLSHILVGLSSTALLAGSGVGVAFTVLAVTAGASVSVRGHGLVLRCPPRLWRTVAVADIAGSRRTARVEPLTSGELPVLGWCRIGRRRWALVMAAGEGVEVELVDGRCYLVVCSRPDELLLALDESRGE